MEWQDAGLVLSARGYGENSLLLSVLTRNHGRCAGFVRGGRNARLQACYQPGSRVSVRWYARLSGQLGRFRCEGLEVFSARYLQDAGRLAALASACGLLDCLLPERDPCPDLFEDLGRLLERLQQADWAVRYLRWETALLAGLGYGLDLPDRYPRAANQALAFDLVQRRLLAAEAAGAGAVPVPAILIEDEAWPDPLAVTAALAITGRVLAGCALTGSGTNARAMTLRQRVIECVLASGRKKDIKYER